MATRAIIVRTFFLENYGDVDNPYWKRKGGETYWICNLDTTSDVFLDKTTLLNGLKEPISQVEIRDSPLCIEMVNDIWDISVEEAERRASINLVECEDYEEYQSYIKKLPYIQTWSV